MEKDYTKEYPTNVFKFFSLAQFHVDAFIDNYLYLSHPKQLNDGLDACRDFLYVENIKTPDVYNQIVESIRQNKPQLINHKLSFSTDRTSQTLKDVLYKSYFDFNGIISFTDSKASIFNNAMWAHYTNEKGFMIEFHTDSLLEGINKDSRNKDFEIVTKKIDYKEKLDAIDCNLIPNIGGLDTNIIFQKQTYWQQENEWRLFAKSNHYLNDTYGRHLFYPIHAIKRVYLGNKFWEEISENVIKEKEQYTIKKDYLPFIINLKELGDKVLSSSKSYQTTIGYKNNKKDNETYHPTRSFQKIIKIEIKGNEIAIAYDGCQRCSEKEL